MTREPIELLAPARDAATGREAILHGADAVYIGGPHFSARAAAGVEVGDIGELCQFAHLYGAKVYVALNTILYDNELKSAEGLIRELYDAGIDALIVQDMSLLRLSLPPIALHASTQCDIRTPKRAKELQAAGFSQLVVARELSLKEIRTIHEAVDVPIEAFVHGALCVSYSGQCYASQHCFQRSANRGECAQFCRMPFDLINGRGEVVQTQRHLLSLRDMNRSTSVEAMMDAGVRSFKIEGRLKDTAYVKNTVAYYRNLIDGIIERRNDEFCRSSFGQSRVAFQPDVSRSFNRGFTDYFLHKPTRPMASIITPASRGKRIGVVTESTGKYLRLRLEGGETVVAGDGLCYVTPEKGMQGFRANKVDGTIVFPHQPQRIKVGTTIYRNHDAAFERTLSHPTATRTLALRLSLEETPTGYELIGEDESGIRASHQATYAHEAAKTPQEAHIAEQLSRWGGTAWHVAEVGVHTSNFIPSSLLAAWRRALCEVLLQAHRDAYQRPPRLAPRVQTFDSHEPLDYRANIANREARAYYEDHGATVAAPAYELSEPSQAAIMTCRYCLRRELGACLREGGEAILPAPLSLRLSDGRTFPLHFHCDRCEMTVWRNDKDHSPH